MYRHRPPLVALMALVATVALSCSCAGRVLDVGYDDGRVLAADPDAPVDLASVAARCAASPAPEEPVGVSPHDGLALGSALLAGRWMLCPGLSPDDAIPRAIEVSDGAAHLLTVQQDGRVSQGEPIAVAISWSLRTETIHVALRGGDGPAASFSVTFQRGPLRMLWRRVGPLSADVVGRFVRIG